MIPIADAAFIRAVDAAAVKEYSISGLQLMENAGRGLAETVKGELLRRGRDLEGVRVAVVAGKGNNGGDGFVAARHLANMGAAVTVYLLAGTSSLSGDSAANCRSWLKMSGAVRSVRSPAAFKKHDSAFRHAHAVVDCIFGTGLTKPVSGFYARVIDYVNSLKCAVIAADVPSGIDARTGAVLGVAVQATVTSTMAMPKTGIYLYPGRGHAGRVEVVDIGVPRALIEGGRGPKSFLVCGRGVAGIIKPRRPDTHKGSYGHMLAAGGSPGKSGAIAMAAMAGIRAGAGLVTIACPDSISAAIEAKTMEVMTETLPSAPGGTLGGESIDALRRVAEGKSAVVIGPGLGSSEDTKAFVERFLKGASVPVVIDADGLNSIGDPAVVKKARADVVLTPHPGEMARLLGVTTTDVQADRIASARTLAQKTRATVVLKGASTVIATPAGDVYINPTGNPALATAGTGDVLAGMVGAMLAQGYTGIEAAVAAVYIHGLAADDYARERGPVGMAATDLLAIFPRLLGHFMESTA